MLSVAVLVLIKKFREKINDKDAGIFNKKFLVPNNFN